jgi:NodT family efflux transporter outer membrane factor (OMF) lipoprotein
LDVRQAETNLATTESELPLFEAGLSVAIYRLSVLLGREPAALYDELSVVREIPKPPAETLVGVPIDLLRRRPDLRAAERRLAAQTAQIGVATADLYPRFSLSGTFGFEATDINHLLDSRSFTYGFGPALRSNIFDGLRNLNRIAVRQAAAHQAYVSYEQTLLLALQDVETALVAYTREQARYAALVRAAEAGRRSAQLAETRYQDGLTDFQNVLIAQRALVNLETGLAQSRGQVSVNLVALYKALGGGWSPDVVPQEQYLDDPSGVLANPMDFFLSGGKGTLPWEARPDEQAETGAASTNPE